MNNDHELVSKLKELASEIGRTPTKTEFMASGVSDHLIRKCGGHNVIVQKAGLEIYNGFSVKEVVEYKPRILVLDIETAPIKAYVWQLWDQNVPLSMIDEDWFILCYAAKWVGEKKVYFKDQRNSRKLQDDKKMLKDIWELMNEADIIVGQNQKSFDVKKLNARFILNGYKPPSSYRQEDTKIMAKRLFGFTSNKLEYMAEKLNVKYKKLKHSKFPGFELWKECLKRNVKAFNEMKKYCIHDVLATEELYLKLAPWASTVNLNTFSESFNNKCSACGHDKFKDAGFHFTNNAKFQKVQCASCGKESIMKENLLSKEKRKSLTRH